MKKINWKQLLIPMLLFLIILILSGCDSGDPQDDWATTQQYAYCSKNGNYTNDYCTEFWNEYDIENGFASLSSYYTQEEVDEMLEGLYDFYIEENEQDIEELKAIVEELQPDQFDRFMKEMMMLAIADGSMVFIELSVNYPEQVEAYGYSATYVYEALEEMDLIITVTVDNDLEFCYYPDGYIDEPICEYLIEGTETFNISINSGFFVLEFESWDEVDDSNLVIMILEDE